MVFNEERGGGVLWNKRGVSLSYHISAMILSTKSDLTILLPPPLKECNSHLSRSQIILFGSNL
jgi:hypothetical protein